MAEYSRFWTDEVLGDAGPYEFGDQWEIDRSVYIDSDQFGQRGPIAGNYEELHVVVDAPASMNVVVESGAGLCYGGWYFNSTDLLLPIAPNAGPGIRFDVVVMRANYAAQTIRCVIVQGVQGAGVPATTRIAGATWDIELAVVEIAMAAGSIVTADITDVRELVGERELYLGIGDFDVDAGGTPAVLNQIPATTTVAWELGPNEEIFATVTIPDEWGVSPLTVSGWVWLWGTVVVGNEVRLAALPYTSGDAAGALVDRSNMTLGVNNQVRRCALLQDIAALVVDPVDLVMLRLQEQTGVQTYFVLGAVLRFRRD